MSTDETSTALNTAMDGGLIPSEVRVMQPQQVEVGELVVSQVGLTPAILPSYSPEQLARIQKEYQFIGRLWDLWMARWEPGQLVPHGDVPGLQTWIKECPISLNEKGSLYRSIHDPAHGTVYQLLVPATLQLIVMQAVHDQWGHQGIGRSYGLLKARCYWPGMNIDVREHVQKCFQCVVTKAQSPKVRPPMHHLLTTI